MTMSSGCHCFHIIIIYGKDVWTEEIPIPFILYRCVILKKYSRDTGRFWQVSFLYAKMGNKTSVPTSWFLEQSCVWISYFRVVVGRRSHRYASFLRLEIKKFILQDCFKNQLVGTLAGTSFLYTDKRRHKTERGFL